MFIYLLTYVSFLFQSAPTMSWSGDHIIIIMVIFSLILTGMCITFLYNCITKLMRDHQTIQVSLLVSLISQLKFSADTTILTTFFTVADKILRDVHTVNTERFIVKYVEPILSQPLPVVNKP